MDSFEVVKKLEKFPHLKSRIENMLMMAENRSGEYDLADDIEMALCKEVNKMGLEFMEMWASNQAAAKAAAAQKQNPDLIKHQKKISIGKQPLEK